MEQSEWQVEQLEWKVEQQRWEVASRPEGSAEVVVAGWRATGGESVAAGWGSADYALRQI